MSNSESDVSPRFPECVAEMYAIVAKYGEIDCDEALLHVMLYPEAEALMKAKKQA